MAKIMFSVGDTYISSRGMYGTAEYTPIYANIDGDKHFLVNLCKPLTGDSEGWLRYEAKKSAVKVEEAKQSLVMHEGQYITFFGQFDDPFAFLKWIKENEYTLEVVRSFFVESDSGGFVDFHGNCSEYSCAFHYRIYDKAMVEKIKAVVSEMNQHII